MNKLPHNTKDQIQSLSNLTKAKESAIMSDDRSKRANTPLIKTKVGKLNKSTHQKLTERTKKMERIPLADQKRTGVDNKDPGYQYRLVNHVSDRIERFKKAGWEMVESPILGDDQRPTKDASQIGVTATQVVNSDGTKASYMRTPKKFFEDDQQKKYKAVDEREKGILRAMPKELSYGNIEGILRDKPKD